MSKNHKVVSEVENNDTEELSLIEELKARLFNQEQQIAELKAKTEKNKKRYSITVNDMSFLWVSSDFEFTWLKFSKEQIAKINCKIHIESPAELQTHINSLLEL